MAYILMSFYTSFQSLIQVLSGRRSSAIATSSTPSSSTSSRGPTPTPPPRSASDKTLVIPRSPSYHHLKRSQIQGLSSSTTNLLDEPPVELSPLPSRSMFTTSVPHHSRLVRATSMTSLGPDDASGINEIVRWVCEKG